MYTVRLPASVSVRVSTIEYMFDNLTFPLVPAHPSNLKLLCRYHRRHKLLHKPKALTIFDTKPLVEQ